MTAPLVRAAVLVLAGIFPQALEDPVALLRRQLMDATAAEAATLRATVERLPEEQRLRGAKELAEYWTRTKRPEDAVRDLVAARGKVGARDAGALEVDIAEALATAGRVDEAVATAQAVLDAPPPPRTAPAQRADRRLREEARERLAQILEGAGRFDEALAHFEAWKPQVIGCGNGVVVRRHTSIGRCHVALGNVDAAFAAWSEAARVAGEFDPATEAITLLVEHAARRDRMQDARLLAARWSDNERSRALWEEYSPLGDAFALRDPRRVAQAFDVVDPKRRRQALARFAGKLLLALGEPGRDAWGERIGQGDSVAILTARELGVRELLPALRSRRAIEKDRRQLADLDSAIASLEPAK